VLVLGLDTSTAQLTLALHDGTRMVAERHALDARRHGELLAPLLRDLLVEAGPAEVTDVACGVGPGPYTSLRVGLVSAVAFAAARRLPVHGVCSLDVLAAEAARTGANRGEPFAVATDARRREVYWATYDPSGTRTSGPAVGHPAGLGLREVPAAGEGPRRYPEAFARPIEPTYPRAAVLAGLVAAALSGSASGTSIELLPPRPLYLRRPDAAEPHSPKPVLT